MSSPQPCLLKASLFIAAISLTAPLALAQAAGQATAADDVAAGAARAEVLERAASLMTQGRLVEARAILIRAVGGEHGALGEAEYARALSLLRSLSDRLKDADPMEVSLQKAELALDQADVRTAELHATAVLRGTQDAAQRTRAQAILDAAMARRAELAPVVPDMLAQAVRDFEAGRYPEAKAGLSAVERSGVDLPDDQRAVLERYQTQIVELERQQGALFGPAGSMGMVQPGVIRRRDEQPAEQPTDQPAEQPPAEELPEPPPAEAQPAQPSPAGDPIQQAMRIQAQEILARADEAFGANMFRQAAVDYEQALRDFRPYLTGEQIRHAEQRLRESRIQLQAQPPAEADLLEEFIQQNQLVRQQVQAEFENQMRQAEAALAEGDVTRARDLAAAARLTASSRAVYFSETEMANFNTAVDALQARIAETERRIFVQQQEQQARELQRIAEEQARQRATERERQINELITRARAYQAEMRYEEALQAVDQLLFLNPIDPAGLLLKDVLTDIIFYRRYNAVQAQKQTGYVFQSLENEEASIPPAGIINYPPDWPAITFRRTGQDVAFDEPPENRRVLSALERRTIDEVTFTDNGLEDVVHFIAQVTELNVDVDWPSLEAVGIQRETPVSLSLRGVSARTLLDRVLDKVGSRDALGGADWAVLDGILTIASEERLRRNQTTMIYDLSDMLIEVPDYDEVPQIDLESVLKGTRERGQAKVASPFAEEGPGPRESEERRREQRLDAIVDIITQSVDFEGWDVNGGDTGRIQRLDGTLIVTNTPKNHQRIQGLLSQLRAIRAMQINVETRFLLVNQDWFEQIGFDVDVIFNANNNQVRAAQALYPQTTARDFFTGRAYNGGRFTPSDADLNGDGDFDDPGESLGAPGTAFGRRAAPWSPINVGQNSLGLASGIAPSSSDWANSILGASPALGIAGQFLDDIQVDFLIQATQADRRSIQLTAPRLTFTNGQVANIYVVTQRAFVSDLAPIVGESAVGFDPEVNTVAEGVTLLIEGTVTADRRYVTMNVDAGVASIDGLAQQAVTAVAGGELVSSADTQSFIQLPTVTVTRVRTTVTVPDQGTLLLGGQRLVTEFEVETGVPVLSKLPVLNRFFTNRIESKEEKTLLILIKPTVLIMSEEEERHFPGLLGQTGFGG